MAAHRTGTDTTAERYDTLACYDHTADHFLEADLGDGRYPSEPVVVPDAEDPERLWLLSVVYDGNADAGEVWIFDAAALADGPVCVLALPEVVPLSFHGCWRPAP
jgi:carotenoid cleavage dioxygenase-like enzyme